MQFKTAQVRSADRPLSKSHFSLRLFRRYLNNRLRAFKAGSLRIELPNGEVIQHSGSEPGPAAAIAVRRWRLVWKLLAEGEIGLARGYVDGDWSTGNLGAVLDYGLRNEAAVVDMAKGWGIAHVLNRLGHSRNANTRIGSRRNIAAHYDLGNDFYRHWLDADMVYSSAIYAGPADTLEAAQERKLGRVVELLDTRDGENVLEIGCGWGALARRLAEAGAGSVTGISLSGEQIDHARSMLARSHAGTRVKIEHRDYRDVTDQFDRIVSIEMFEAVGERYWPIYFEQLDKCLKPDGVILLQIITIADKLFESYRARPDFIQQYIFPGGMLPTVDMIRDKARRSGFRIESYERFGESYERTLQTWQKRFDAAWPKIEPLGFDDRFRRMWDYYLDYCAAGFRHGSIDVGLFKLVRM